MEFCFGLFIILWIIGIIAQIVSGKSPSPSRYNDDFDPFDPEEDPYDDETLLAILLMEDDDRDDHGPEL